MNASTPKKSALTTKLRNMGNHLHNAGVLRCGSGVLVVGYRPQRDDVNPEDYVPCSKCFLYLIHHDFWRHKCPLQDANGQKKPGLRAARLVLPNKSDVDHPIDDIVRTLRMDVVGRAVRSDPLIIALGRKLCPTHAHDLDRHNALREHMRRLGRLLIQLRLEDGDPDARLKHFIDPQKFRAVFSATKVITGFNSLENTMQVPSLALKIGHDLKKCAMIVKCEALENADPFSVDKAEKFYTVLEDNWAEITAPAHRVMNDVKQNKAKLLPLTEDIMKLSSKLKEKGKMSTAKLQEAKKSGFTSDHKRAWSTLNEIALAYVILFNRRRAGEVSKMLLRNYSERQAPGNQAFVNECLSEVERALCASFTRIEITGKKGRTVPILLNEQVGIWIANLVEFRSAAGVTEHNVFLFPRAHFSSKGHIRGCDVMRSWSEEAGAQQPELLRSTKLRKHVATVAQIVNLKKNELDILANFMGHDIRVHREFYRLPQETLQVAKVSKLLLACEKGIDISGKSLDDIDIAVDEEVNRGSASEEDDDDDDENDDKSDDELPRASVFVPVVNQGEKSVTKKLPRRLGRFTTDEKKAIIGKFSQHIIRKQCPQKNECDRCLAAEPSLSGRDWRQIKDFCRFRFETKEPLKF